jgi:DNA-binding transcriptional MerR regulator/methylmalonyl-CoA mutase cobalamin-binding subunit
MLSIGFVAANLGVSTSTLRKWEERYGHPTPLRSEGGSRWYRHADLLALRQAKRLLDRGIRAHKVFADFDTLLAAVETAPVEVQTPEPSNKVGSIRELLELVERHELIRLKSRLEALLQDQGAEVFVETTAGPLMREVGERWAQGLIDVFQEHGVATALSTVLAPYRLQKAPSAAPIVVLTTPPGEQHGIALDMVSAALGGAGAQCINLGPGLPLSNLLAAAEGFRPEVVGLSVSSVNAGRLVRRFIAELRRALDDDIELWIGGSGATLMPALPDGVRAFYDTREPSRLLREIIEQRRVQAPPE